VAVVGLILLPIVLAATLAGPGGPGGDDDAGGGEAGGGAAVQERSGGAGASRGFAPADGGFAPGRSERRIERSVSLELDVALDDLARVAEDVTAVANRHGGFVLSSSVDTGEESGGGDFSLGSPRTACARRSAISRRSHRSSARAKRAATSPAST
jgi:hypothetical protein